MQALDPTYTSCHDALCTVPKATGSQPVNDIHFAACGKAWEFTALRRSNGTRSCLGIKTPFKTYSLLAPAFLKKTLQNTKENLRPCRKRLAPKHIACPMLQKPPNSEHFAEGGAPYNSYPVLVPPLLKNTLQNTTECCVRAVNELHVASTLPGRCCKA